MTISNFHNLVDAPPDSQGRFGIRASLTESDPFKRLLSAGWETFYWYASRAARDNALREMSARHHYSRIGDTPTVRYEPVER
ncbi:MAG: hypothetical protein ACE5G3_03505 [Gammaproteobacteria bacterium]